MISIALDGPAGAGKSTIAKSVAAKLGFIYVDTGALYRAIGLKFLNSGYGEKADFETEKVLGQTVIEIKFINGVQHVFLDNKDVNDKIRTPEISKMASEVSAKPPVRAFLLEMQRDFAKKNNVIMDGRDIGTVVLPNATLKFFVTASASERAKRRVKDIEAQGIKADFNEVLADIEKRDYNDSHREIAPLKPANDSIIFDTTGDTLEQSVEKLVKIIKEKAETV